ncbi:MAG TPA: hypothetical protein EYQ82_07900 [Dehalococcoidia bacterium]|nr:hypothetical protein [Dehalococcoidia bacterium]
MRPRNQIRPRSASALNRSTGAGWALLAGMVLFSGSPLAAQSQSMNFFVLVQGPGGAAPAIAATDANCQDTGYAEGFGRLTWRAYLNGTSADGEASQIGRQRIGEGPWFNFRGVEIAANLDQLHSDGNNLSAETAVTVYGQPVPEGALEIPSGSQLDAANFTREGPLFCFGLP